MTRKVNELIKFSFFTGIMALFFDAVIGHGLLWDNDPYWNYWIVDSFLLATVTFIASSFTGIGIWQGFITIGVHTLLLETYYDVLSPVGLPQEPLWLSKYDVWIVGYSTHFLVYLTGYLFLVWIWRRKHKAKNIMEDFKVRKLALIIALSAIVVLLLEGIITQGFLFKEFFGVTFLIQRFVLTFIFLLIWLNYVGLDLKGFITGSFLLSLYWLTYNMYLGPIGLPTSFPRYLDYNELWFKVFPSSLISALIVLGTVRRFLPKGEKA